MTTTSLMGIATSSVQAYQQALQTTSNNIANANTPGYALEQVTFSTAPGQATGSYYLGSGVQVDGVQRMVNSVANAQVNSANSSYSRYQTSSQYASQIDNLLGNQQTGLQPALQNFFNAIQGVASSPTSVSARQELISQGQNLAGTFNNLSQQINTTSTQLNGQISSTVGQINSLASQIANLNVQIRSQNNNNVVGKPNGLLDQRDQLLTQLSKLVSVTAVPQADGTDTILIGTGQALVVGGQTTKLGTSPLNGDPNQLGVVFQTTKGNVPITNLVSGGSLGGLLDARNNVIVPALNQLGQIAVGISQTMNQQQSQGVDLQGNLGTNMFNTLSPTVIAEGGASTGGQPAITFSSSSPSALTGNDYQLTYTGTAWNLTNVETGKSVAMSGAGTAASPYTADGLSIVVPSSPSTGASWMIEPTRNAAANIQMNALTPQQIAARSVMSSSAASTNNGSATISSPTLTTTPGNVVTTPVTIAISGTPPNTWTATNTATGATLASGTYNSNPSGTTPGATISIPGAGWSVSLSGGAQSGDSFTVSPPGPSGNGNALALANLQQTKTLEGQTATFGQGYSQLIANIGTVTQAAQNNATTQQGVLQQTTQIQQSISGVNLNQQAANLLLYQQGYQASATVISTANKLFQALLSAV